MEKYYVRNKKHTKLWVIPAEKRNNSVRYLKFKKLLIFKQTEEKKSLDLNAILYKLNLI